ncbi:MAG: UDP-N-acetylmuramate dehydrogenase [Panacagrimonas sp.]
MNACAQLDDSARLAVRGRLLQNEPMSAHTSWRVGGPAARYFEPADRNDLIAYLRTIPSTEPLLWLGLGSNLLVRDGGWPGSVICLHSALQGLAMAGEQEIFAEAGVHCARLAKFARKNRRAGLGFMAGIPGTVGGALAMNAGAWGAETWPQVQSVEVIWRDGRSQWLEPGAFTYSYRQLSMPSQVAGFLGARFRVLDDADGVHAKQTRQWLDRRKATQPVGRPSAGSTFRNPPGDFAARLIDAAGLKGFAIGGARVSELHANFIITSEGARAADVEQLIEHIRRTVQTQTKTDLIPEVRMVGEAA